MKQGIHPEYKIATVTCACGNTFTTRSLKEEIHVEICSKCHPFFTGKQKIVDTGGRVERFLRKYGPSAITITEPGGEGALNQNLQYGGQAVIEGVMMRSPRYFAVACRAPDGQIVLKLEDLASFWLSRLRWLNRPFLRGTLALLDAMALGIRALRFSADVQLEEQAQTVQQKRINDLAIGSTMVVGLAVGLGLFVALPTALTQLLPWKYPLLLNMLDGVIRIVLFLGYVLAVGSLREIRRVFQYHGAEHKTINTFEAGLPLTMENAKRQSRIHPRCGTSFVMVVLILAIFVFALTGRPPIWLRIPLHILLLPLVAGIAYEAIKFGGRHKDSRFTRWLLAPGMWSQYLTTREPDEAQIEVALRALQAVVEQELQREEPVPVA